MTDETMPLTVIQPHPVKESRVKIGRSIMNTGFLNVWEGAIRSGKTVVALMSFLYYVLESDERTFFMSGRTIATIEKNCIVGDYGVKALVPGAKYGMAHKSMCLKLPSAKGTKIIYVYGASDIESYQNLRGLTAAGWFADEINLHHPEFVAEGFKRTVASKDRKHFWTLNPDNPFHWVYEKYIDFYDYKTKEEKKAIGGFHLWHFLPKDNPILTDDRLNELAQQYVEGSFEYRRYILGERCMAEGLIYPQATRERCFFDFKPEQVNIRYASIDYGTDHPTVIYFGGQYNGNRKKWAIIREYYDKGSDKTTLDHWEAFCDICRKLNVDPLSINVAIDPAAGAIKKEFQAHKAMAFNARNDVLDGIAFLKKILYNGDLILHESCTQAAREFATYAWDEKASERGEDKPVKINDDCMDSLRYFAYTHIRPILGG